MPIGFGSDTEMTWSSPQCHGDIPNKRSGHSFTLKQVEKVTSIYMFGGCDYSNSPRLTSDMYLLQSGASLGQYQWSKVIPKMPSPEDMPEPRWRHSTVLYKENKLVVFGGFGLEKRLNDVWVFDTEYEFWEQPHPQSPWENVPQCRGSHSATLVGDLMYIFGGYGGNGYGRLDFNDLHVLDLKTWKWSEIVMEGEIPEPRSGHQACLVNNQLFIIGGWNNVKQFNDVYIFDLERRQWSRSEASLDVPTWNHSAVGVWAVPSWKIFVFGGSSGDLAEAGGAQGTYLNTVRVLDTGSMSWHVPQTQGVLPCPRADTEVIFDKKNYQIMFFGGWANRWYGDLQILSVQEIVGPPYSVSSVDPQSGAITGGQTIQIKGCNFLSGTVTVRFAVHKGFVDTTGKVIDDTTIETKTPNFGRYGAILSEVRVCLPGETFTNTAVKFKFHSVTSSGKSIAFGQSLLAPLHDTGVIGVPSVFFIQSFDKDGIPRDCGQDEFDIKVVPRDNSSTALTDAVDIQDLNNGYYKVTFTPLNAGSYDISVYFNGTFGGDAGYLRGFPCTAIFQQSGSLDVTFDQGKGLESSQLIQKVSRCTKKRVDEYEKILGDLKKDIPKDEKHGLETLIQLKDTIHTLEKDKLAHQLLIDQITDMLIYVKSVGVHVDKEIQSVEKLKSKWEEIQKTLPQVQQKILGPTRLHSEKTQERIEEYETKITKQLEVYKELEFWKYTTGVTAAQDLISRRLLVWQEEMDICNTNCHLCRIFEFPKLMDNTTKMMETMRDNMLAMKELWNLINKCLVYFNEAEKKKWMEIDSNGLAGDVNNFGKELKRIPNGVQWCDAFKEMIKKCKNFEKICPLIRMLREPYLRPRHWTALMKFTGTFNTPVENPDTLLEDMLRMNLHQFSSDIEEICYAAEKEKVMEEQLADLEHTWDCIEWTMELYKTTDVPTLKILEEHFEALENNQMEVQAMLSSPYQGDFGPVVMEWQQSLANINEVVMILTEIQRSWSYLEPLFIHSEEVRKQLPALTEAFQDIDVNVKEVLKSSWEIRQVKKACNVPGLFKKLDSIVEALNSCKMKLTKFLDGRRRQFPRFYFISEADLLDILSNGSKPEKILIHTPKIYLCTSTLTLEKVEGDRPKAIEWISGVGHERVKLEEPVHLKAEAEIYLEALLRGMKYTLFCQVEKSLHSYMKMNRCQWLNEKDESGEPISAAQIILLVAAITYVQGVEQAFHLIEQGNKNALEEYRALQQKQLEDLICLTRGKVSKADRQRIMCVITMDAHGRDIVASMVRSNVQVTSSFQWQSQLKHYFSPAQGSFLQRDMTFRGPNNERAQVLICDAGLPYDYEYLGNGPRLVITPLTDRIYVTATQALNLKMGCAPAGPAGTGKTESTKDLANALGMACYVFNCSPEMDYQSLGNIFKGLASSGSWGCFDEFNRLVPEVLSVCTVQFKAVCDATKRRATMFFLEDAEISLDPAVGVFITMNPGYLGRSELPEGLKALFRPMTVMVPDLVLICENMLMAEGFTQAKLLASKFYGLYSLLGQLLSKQMHYDWGLRAVKSVLVVAGAFKRAEPEMPEEDLLMRALRDFNVPKIVAEDAPIFFGLLGDLFPRGDQNTDLKNDPPRKRDLTLEENVEIACGEMGNYPHPEFMLKVVQLDELLAIRHCVFVMGPPASGKTQTWKTLQKAKELMKPAVKVQDINPKSVDTNELYGYIVMKTREWKDGLLSKIMRDLGNIPDESPKWIILDGDLDANWIESMNSVMDDNRMLTLASNERIPLKSYMRLVFEIRDLVYATPATVSRAGILYISSSEGYQWQSLIRSWLTRKTIREGEKSSSAFFKPELRDHIQSQFDEYCAKALRYLRKNCSPVLPVEDVSLVQNLINMLECMLTPSNTSDTHVVNTIFSYCCVWAFGSILTTADDGTNYAVKFSTWWKNEFTTIKYPASSNQTLFDFWLDPEGNKFDSWAKSPYFYTEVYHSPSPINQITVPTTETASLAFWMRNLMKKKVPMMVAGPAGTGKTQNVLGVLKKLVLEDSTGSEPFMYTSINFNFYTTSTILQKTMATSLEKKIGINYGPPGNSNLIYFLDDLNLPEVDPYNTQSAISLLRQKMEYKHWYDRTKLTLQVIKNTQVVAAMNPTAGSFLIDPRLQRHFCIFALGMPEPPSLVTIYKTFLGGHLSKFGEEISNPTFWSSIIKASLALHSSISTTFRKTAANFHYEFNIRHISFVFQGLIASQPDRFRTGEKFVQLWLHECERVYGDRLVCLDDIAKYQQLAQQQVKKAFPNYNMGKYFALENAEPLIFCHFTSNEDKDYEQISSLTTLNEILMEHLIYYNTGGDNAAMDLDLFDDAMKHIARIVRIFRNESGHALLVGVGGSGKRSLARLSAHICDFAVRQITISSKYNENDFKDDIKKMHMEVATLAASRSEAGIVFLLTDSQITNEKFLIFINDLLASGNIPDLFAVDEMDTIISQLTSVAESKERSVIWNYFINQVKLRLHLCLCFSPVGDDFRNRARKFPALVNCTVIDWFQPWPKEALYSVGKKKLAECDLGSEEIRQSIEDFMPESFVTVNKVAKRFLQVERRYVYTTPKSYLELLQLYVKILSKKRSEYHAAIDRLERGLKKLKETGDTVSQLEEDLKLRLDAAEEKKAVSQAIAENVYLEKAKVEIENKKANEEAAKCAAIQADVTEKQKSTEEDLAKAEPAVIEAMQALDTLNKKDLGECKTMSKPPAGVDSVFAATMVLLAGVYPNVLLKKGGKVKDISWDAAKKQLLANIPEYLDALRNFKAVVDSGEVPQQNWKEVRSFLEQSFFNPSIIMTKNSAAAGLCSWVINIVTYYDILITVEPKRRALAEANEMLSTANKRLSEVNELVATLQAKLDELMAAAEMANKAEADATASVEAGKKKMMLARQLTGDLGSENERWSRNVVQLTKERDVLVGDALLASAFISYIGPFTKPFRDELLNEHWVPFLKKTPNGGCIPMSDQANPVYVLTNDAEIAKWNTQSLPADRVSTENGTIVVNTVTMGRRPLIIDPQLQGISWIREMEAQSNLCIVRIGQSRWLDKLKMHIQTENALLIENIGEKIDAILNPVIQRAVTARGQKFEINIGDDSIPYNPKFRLYLHTKLSNPHYPPEIQAECTIVNFTVTSLGLEDQLLNLTVGKERADLAAKREQLIYDQNQGKIELKLLEDNILTQLASSDGDITENQELIMVLRETKQKADRTFIEMAAAKQMQEALNETSEKYRSVAARSSLLFFLMNDLSKIHSYYMYSLAAFKQVFLQGIAKAPIERKIIKEKAREIDSQGGDENQNLDGSDEEAVEDIENEETSEMTDEEFSDRCSILCESITSSVFDYIRRGLFERDKLTVATQLCLKILVSNGTLTQEDIDYFLVSKQASDTAIPSAFSDWLPYTCWLKLKALEGLKGFGAIVESFSNDPGAWRKWFDAENGEVAKIPGDFANLNDFQRIILLRALRPDRVTNALKSFVGKMLGERYVSQPTFDMEKVYQETTPSIPIFFVLFPGVDPTPWVESLAKTLGISSEKGNFTNMSMGQGQEVIAETLLRKYSAEGGWIILQNVHLMQTWLTKLERILEEIAGEGSNETFRCFISAEPPPLSNLKNVPESLLQSCIKVANEAPSDVQSNLRRAWANFDEDRIQTCTKSSEFKACLFSLCWFHAIVLGRRRFGQQGWSRAYSFNTGDLTICANVLQSYLENNPLVPWDDLRYIFGEIMYGGHITDAWDRRTNNTYLEVLFNERLLDGLELAVGIKSPDPRKMDYEGYSTFIETGLPPEAPTLFRLHPNAEIGYLTATCESICSIILGMSGTSGSGSESSRSTKVVRELIDDLSSRCPEPFNILDIKERASFLMKEQRGPFVVVACQECIRMNALLHEIKKSLSDLMKGLNGQLSMSQAMEDLVEALAINQVPGRNIFSLCSWEKRAWPSRKSLASWFEDMVKRYQQLLSWTSDFITPFSLWLPGLFNPTAYTTACLQVTSRAKKMPLNRMTIETHVTTFLQPSDVTYTPEDGVFVHGLMLEGARWTTLEESSLEGAKETIGTDPPTLCSGYLADSYPKELLSSMPVVYVKAVQTLPNWEPTSVGYLRGDPNIYECPVYMTRFRGPTYVFLATLKTSVPSSMWILRGVAILFQDDC